MLFFMQEMILKNQAENVNAIQEKKNIFTFDCNVINKMKNKILKKSRICEKMKEKSQDKA